MASVNTQVAGEAAYLRARFVEGEAVDDLTCGSSAGMAE
jgi:hypothetical protein